MVPFPMLPTTSAAERRLYEAFLEQLGPEYVVYHSVDWVLAAPRPGAGPIQGEADFILAHPLDGLLVLEVKGGRLRYDPEGRRWLQAGRHGEHVLDEDPFHQARGEMHSLVDILKAQPGWDRWRPSYGYGVAFPDGAYEADAHPGAPAAVTIDRHDLDRLPQRVKEIMRHWRSGARTFGAEGMEALDRALGFRVEIRTPLKLEFDEEDRTIVELTQDQSYALANLSHLRRAAVVGPAGSGKTVLAVHIAERLAARGRPTLLTCFNRRLAGELSRQAGDTPHLEVAHFHGLCSRLAREAGLTVPNVPSDDEGSRDHFERVLPDLLAQAAGILGPRYHAMVVDEAQDFRESWWPALLRLHEDPDHGLLFVFADDNQNLYGGTLPIRSDEPTWPLRANLRNTRSVHDFVSVFYRGKEPPLGKGPLGHPVEILGYRDEEELAHLLLVVLRNLAEESVPLEDVVLLTPAGSSRSALQQRGRVDGIPFAGEPAPGALLVSSIHAFKGLERQVVILAEIEDKHRDELGSYLYVGGSRARNHLIVLAAESVAHELREMTGVEG